MPRAERTATTIWEGTLTEGGGSLSLASGVLSDAPVTWASRTARSEGKTSPEELIAAAHCSCFSMALSSGLTKAGTPPQKLEVSATVTLDTDAGGVQSSKLTVKGHVPGIDAAAFDEAAQSAGQNCPISGALKGNITIEVEAELVDG